jgi:hypothetical protein
VAPQVDYLYVRHSITSASGGAQGNGSGRHQVDLRFRYVIHTEWFRGNGNGASLFATLRLDRLTKQMRVEFHYTDTTVLDAGYLDATATVTELLEDK